MKSKNIPASLEVAQKAVEMVKDQIAALEISTATKKRPSLQDNLNKERLQGLLYADTLNDDEMERFGKLLDPAELNKASKQLLATLNGLTKNQLAERLANAEINLQIERGFAGVASRVIDDLWHKIDGDEYKKITSSANRQSGRQAIFAEDDKRLAECFKEIRKRKGSPLASEDYGAFRHEVYLHYPESLMKQAPRLTGELKDLTPAQQEEERDYMREDSPGWSESRLRYFFEKYAKVKAVKK
uniref:hypothetical protein n=1 Tax=Polynucleobacter sp. TaxID=2029855 RepID=UPI00404724F1